MKRISLALSIFVLVMVALWFLRWESLESTVYQGVKTVYSKDRWTGQTWLESYKSGTVNEKPAIDEDTVKAKTDEVNSRTNELYLAAKTYDEYSKSDEFRIKEAQGRGDQKAWDLYTNMIEVRENNSAIVVNELTQAAWDERNKLTKYWYYTFGTSILLLLVSVYFSFRDGSARPSPHKK